jgi:hypothetical protein
MAFVVGVSAANAAAPSFVGVPSVPGAFELKGGPKPLTVGDKPLQDRDVVGLAGTSNGFDLLVDGVSVFSLDYAHRTGRREPLRSVAMDLSDWKKAPACPPDRVLIDPAHGRLRFFPGHDPAAFRSEVTATIREMGGDSALGAWQGDRFFLSHWSINPNLWAYDVSDPKHPRKIGEVQVPSKTYGLLTVGSGRLIVGTDRGTHCVDVSDPGHMKVSGLLGPGQWFNPITSRYVAGWKSPAETTHFQ